MKYSIQYIGLFFLFTVVLSCSEGSTAPSDEESPAPATSSTLAEDNKGSTTAPTTADPAPEEVPVASVAPYQLDFKAYEADWFALEYPETFTVKEQKNKMEKEDPYRGDISLFLTAPDQQMTFFAFPIYGHSQPKGIAIDEATEEYINNSQHQQGKLVRIRAKDGSYIREYQYDEYHFWGQQYDTPTTKALYADAFERFYQSIGATEG